MAALSATSPRLCWVSLPIFAGGQFRELRRAFTHQCCRARQHALACRETALGPVGGEAGLRRLQLFFELGIGDFIEAVGDLAVAADDAGS